MKIKLLVAAALLALSLAFTYQPKAQLWEYTSTTSEKNLNELGQQGWELVSTTSYFYTGAGERKTFYFKRAK